MDQESKSKLDILLSMQLNALTNQAAILGALRHLVRRMDNDLDCIELISVCMAGSALMIKEISELLGK